ncbi:MAG: cupin domain-containing protein [Oscillospiraceae bacterium]|nr:cupin domain-containing protein [Oscillospiraceae bacterium]
MIKTPNQLTITTEDNARGEVKMHLHNLADFPGRNPKLRMFSNVKLKPGEEVEFHIHTGEFESYYIISGKGLYQDNDEFVEVEPGTVTFTPSGQGHGIKNIGDEILEFIALIVLD